MATCRLVSRSTPARSSFSAVGPELGAQSSPPYCPEKLSQQAEVLCQLDLRHRLLEESAMTFEGAAAQV
jgi:hypothetical protein